MDFDRLKQLVFKHYYQKGFYQEMSEHGRFGDIVELALIGSEVTEAIEEIRKPEINKESLSEEMADIFIRGMNFCNRHNIDLQSAIIKKNDINEKREFRHGKAV